MSAPLLDMEVPDSLPEGLSVRDVVALNNYNRLMSMEPGPRERAIREQLDISPPKFFQLINALMDDHAAYVYKPALINTLRRARAARRARYW